MFWKKALLQSFHKKKGNEAHGPYIEAHVHASYWQAWYTHFVWKFMMYPGTNWYGGVVVSFFLIHFKKYPNGLLP